MIKIVLWCVVLIVQFVPSRWDIQHMRAIQAHQNLEKKCRDREEARFKGKKSGCKDDAAKSVESFLPASEDGEWFIIMIQSLYLTSHFKMVALYSLY